MIYAAFPVSASAWTRTPHLYVHQSCWCATQGQEGPQRGQVLAIARSFSVGATVIEPRSTPRMAAVAKASVAKGPARRRVVFERGSVT
jgi:hypothetical protein